ncbi:hypothetical protein [Chitinophaga vietnamensis]|uniref:hypothetical protein n=1 Tax=Chitinophaga vietnamensis TaxID=2593957 RepID=UPI001178C4FE|nr:hypothetical protein [Chitinophaga vietnamensis]
MQKHLFSFIIILGTAFTPALAQTAKKKPVPAKPAAVSNKKPKRLVSTWGIFLSDTLPKNEIVKLLDSAITVRDEKNNRYPIVSFAFTYEHHEPYLNDTTGQPAVYKDFTGDNFKSAALPVLWSSRLKESLAQGDVLYFDEIIIKYTEDKLYKAPSLKITVR